MEKKSCFTFTRHMCVQSRKSSCIIVQIAEVVNEMPFFLVFCILFEFVPFFWEKNL